MKGSWLHKGLMVLLASVVLAGCTSRPAPEAEQTSSLKVMFMDEGYFFQQYGDLFAMEKPNIEIEVVSTNSIYRDNPDGVTDYTKALEEFIEKEQPDVVMLNTESYEKMASEGKLAELDTLIERDKYDTESIYPALMEILKDKGGGKLYGLSPTFYGNAIFYNADLFAKYGIEVPHDGMTWQEILDTARRFPTDGDKDTRVYGFGTNYGMTMDQLASNIASTQGLKFINTDTMKVTLNTDSWKQAYKLAMDAMDSQAIYNPGDDMFQGGSMEDYYKSQLFMMGRMAMTVDGSYMLQSLKDAQNQVKDYQPFQLGAVAGPVDPADPETSRNIFFNDIFGIRANSPNADAAWEFIKFINGEKFAKVKSRTMNGGLLSRMNVTKEFNGMNLDVFYKLKPSLSNDRSEDYTKIPDAFNMEYYGILTREIQLAQDKKKSIDEALQTIESEAQALLDKAIKDEAAGKTSSDGSTAGEDGGAATSGESGAETGEATEVIVVE
ncbi:ABC transporter substrate-binding protein [Paenibacillus senegalimassiliensis]|uniref:ABC transporter substrate-binding protein n=1 Tax=Paenibacillus senegalimassiliensis TaxID=1737426 RepID=UPI00073E728D|nr:extracellular solute-binding protein [Paenibacillus senegalimassiliensis]